MQWFIHTDGQYKTYTQSPTVGERTQMVNVKRNKLSGFRAENLSLLAIYAASSGKFLSTLRYNLSVPSSADS